MASKNPHPKKVLDTEEAAEYLGIVSAKTLANWRKQYRKDGTRKGPRFVDLEGQIGYPVAYLDEYLESRASSDRDEFVA